MRHRDISFSDIRVGQTNGNTRGGTPRRDVPYKIRQLTRQSFRWQWRKLPDNHRLKWYNELEMAPLIKTNKYLSDENIFRRIVRENARASSVLEGASSVALREIDTQDDNRKVIASSKNADNGS